MNNIRRKLRSPDVIENARGNPVLTIGKRGGFGRQGDIVSFYAGGNRVRFEINVDAAEKARLKIRSQLLNLAKIIREEPKSRGI